MQKNQNESECEHTVVIIVELAFNSIIQEGIWGTCEEGNVNQYHVSEKNRISKQFMKHSKDFTSRPPIIYLYVEILKHVSFKLHGFINHLI